MAFKIRDDFRDTDRVDPKIGVGPPKATSLGRLVGTLPSGAPQYGDERIFSAGDLVPDAYVSDALRERFDAGDPAVLSVFERVDGGEESYTGKEWTNERLDEEVARRGVAVTGTGAGGNATKKDKADALQAADRSGDGQRTASGAPATTFGSGNPFAGSDG